MTGWGDVGVRAPNPSTALYFGGRPIYRRREQRRKKGGGKERGKMVLHTFGQCSSLASMEKEVR